MGMAEPAATVFVCSASWLVGRWGKARESHCDGLCRLMSGSIRRGAHLFVYSWHAHTAAGCDSNRELSRPGRWLADQLAKALENCRAAPSCRQCNRTAADAFASVVTLITRMRRWRRRRPCRQCQCFKLRFMSWIRFRESTESRREKRKE